MRFLLCLVLATGSLNAADRSLRKITTQAENRRDKEAFDDCMAKQATQLVGHSSLVTSAAFYEEGTRCAIGSESGEIIIYAYNTTEDSWHDIRTISTKKMIQALKVLASGYIAIVSGNEVSLWKLQEEDTECCFSYYFATQEHAATPGGNSGFKQSHVIDDDDLNEKEKENDWVPHFRQSMNLEAVDSLTINLFVNEAGTRILCQAQTSSTEQLVTLALKDAQEEGGTAWSFEHNISEWKPDAYLLACSSSGSHILLAQSARNHCYSVTSMSFKEDEVEELPVCMVLQKPVEGSINTGGTRSLVVTERQQFASDVEVLEYVYWEGAWGISGQTRGGIRLPQESTFRAVAFKDNGTCLVHTLEHGNGCKLCIEEHHDEGKRYCLPIDYGLLRVVMLSAEKILCIFNNNTVQIGTKEGDAWHLGCKVSVHHGKLLDWSSNGTHCIVGQDKTTLIYNLPLATACLQAQYAAGGAADDFFRRSLDVARAVHKRGSHVPSTLFLDRPAAHTLLRKAFAGKDHIPLENCVKVLTSQDGHLIVCWSTNSLIILQYTKPFWKTMYATEAPKGDSYTAVSHAPGLVAAGCNSGMIVFMTLDDEEWYEEEISGHTNSILYLACNTGNRHGAQGHYVASYSNGGSVRVWHRAHGKRSFKEEKKYSPTEPLVAIALDATGSRITCAGSRHLYFGQRSASQWDSFTKCKNDGDVKDLIASDTLQCFAVLTLLKKRDFEYVEPTIQQAPPATYDPLSGEVQEDSPRSSGESESQHDVKPKFLRDLKKTIRHEYRLGVYGSKRYQPSAGQESEQPKGVRRKKKIPPYTTYIHQQDLSLDGNNGNYDVHASHSSEGDTGSFVDPPQHLTMHGSGKYIAMTVGGRIILWMQHKEEEHDVWRAQQLGGANAEVVDMQFSDRACLTVTLNDQEHTVKVFDLSNSEPKNTFNHQHNEPLCSALFLPCSETLVCHTQSGNVELVRTVTFQEIKELTHPQAVFVQKCLDLEPNNRLSLKEAPDLLALYRQLPASLQRTFEGYVQLPQEIASHTVPDTRNVLLRMLARICS